MGFSKEDIAPCGINCGTCLAYREGKCRGCLNPDNIKAARSIKCGIKFCRQHKKAAFTYCYECPTFPCPRLASHEKRYVEKHGLSVIANLKYIGKHGIADFINKENEKWRCGQCGEVLCVHRRACLNCGKEYR